MFQYTIHEIKMNYLNDDIYKDVNKKRRHKNILMNHQDKMEMSKINYLIAREKSKR